MICFFLCVVYFLGFLWIVIVVVVIKFKFKNNIYKKEFFCSGFNLIGLNYLFIIELIMR